MGFASRTDKPDSLSQDIKRSGSKAAIFPGLDSLEIGFLVLCLCIYLSWTLCFTSMGYGPDEYMRYDVPKFIFLNHALPIGSEESIRNPTWGISYGFDITLPYLLEAAAMWVASKFVFSDLPLLIAARLVSVFSTVCTAYFAILFSKKTMGASPLRWVFIVMMALLPQIVFLSSYVNLDSFSLFSVMVILYGWTVCLEREWDRPSAALLAVGLGLCLASYQFAYSYVLATFFLYVTWHLMYRRRRSFKAFLTRGLLILAITFVICGWRFIRNAVLFDGDFLALNASTPYIEMYAEDWLKPSVRQTYAKSGLSILGMLRETPWLAQTGLSLIGVFGYMSIYLPWGYYKVFLLLMIVGAAGVLAKAIAALSKEKDPSAWKDPVLMGIWMAFASAVTVFLSLYNSWSTDYQPQGRYVIVTTPLLFLAAAMGLDHWLGLLGGKIKGNAGGAPTLKTVCAWAVLGFVLMGDLIGYYYCLENFIY